MNKPKGWLRVLMVSVLAFCAGAICLRLCMLYIETALPFMSPGSYIRFALGVSFGGTGLILVLAGIGMIVGIVRGAPKS